MFRTETVTYDQRSVISTERFFKDAYSRDLEATGQFTLKGEGNVNTCSAALPTRGKRMRATNSSVTAVVRIKPGREVEYVVSNHCVGLTADTVDQKLGGKTSED